MGYKQKIEEADKNNIPISATFELTDKCNLNCIFCYVVKEKRKELTTEEIKSALDQLADAGTLFLNLTGGEVLTRKDFFEIAEYARKKDFAIRVLTNGTLINEKIAEKLKKLRPLSVEISTHCMNHPLFDSVTRVPGSAKKIFRAMKLLKKRKIHVVIKTTLMRHTFNEFEKIKKFRKKMRFGLDYSPTIFAKNNGSAEPIQYRLADEQIKKMHWNSLRRFKTKELLKEAELFNKNIPRCVIPCCAASAVVSISAYGDVYPCVQLVSIKAGNLMEKSFKEIWKESRELKRIRKLKKVRIEKCSSCESKFHCFFCAGQVLLEGGNIMEPFPESCRTANAYVDTVKAILQKRRIEIAQNAKQLKTTIGI